jgi:hypothetical protein
MDEFVALDQFFDTLRAYNCNKEMNPDFKTNVTDFFIYKWNNDRNQALRVEKDIANFEEIPSELQDKLFYLYLCPKFMNTF